MRLASAQIESDISAFLGQNRGSEATRGTYQRALRVFVRWVRIQRRFTYSQRDVERYKEAIGHLSPASVSAYLTAVRRFFDYQMRRGKIEKNPARDVKGHPRPTFHSRGFLTQKQVGRLLGSIDREDEMGLRDFAIINLMVKTGLLEIEIQRIDVDDFRSRSGKSVLYVQGKGRRKKDAFVILDRKVSDSIRKYLSSRASAFGSDPLFCGVGNRSVGNRMTTRAIRERVRFHLRRAGIRGPHITPYSLRHTAALRALENNVPPSEVQKMLRHADLSTTLVYVRLLKNRGKKGGL